MNPADDASRGLSATEFIRSRWTLGPEFLWEVKEQWPRDAHARTQSMNELSQQDPQVKRVTVLATAVMKSESTLEDRLKRFSEWQRAKKAVGLSLSYVNRLRELAKKQNQSRNENITIKVEDTQQAENIIIKSDQGLHFEKDLESVKSFPSFNSSEDRQLAKQKRACTKSTMLHKLGPFLDYQGILRAGGHHMGSSSSSYYQDVAM